jgi:FdhE protein
MAAVPIQTLSHQDLVDWAERRWQAVGRERPDLQPALDLQRELLRVVMELAATFERMALPRLSLPPKYVAAKLTRGVPALAGEPIPLPPPPLERMKAALLDLCTVLADGGAGDAARHIHAEIESGRMEAGSLLTASLMRHQTVIRTGAIHRGLSPDLVWLVAELAVSPFVHALRATLSSSRGDLRLGEAVERWSFGYCSICGSWPALAEFSPPGDSSEATTGGHRVLRCSFCSNAWEPVPITCIYCGEDHNERFRTVVPDEGRPGRRIEVCATCNGYLKAEAIDSLSPFPLLSISDIETTDLDMVAMERGYRRPPLKEFGHGRVSK